MIAIYRRTPTGVVRAASASTRAEAIDKLRGIAAPAAAFNGGAFVAATGYTSAPDLAAITAHVGAHSRHSEVGVESCEAPECPRPRGRESSKTLPHLVALCIVHRRRVRACRNLDQRDPAAVAAYLARRAADG